MKRGRSSLDLDRRNAKRRERVTQLSRNGASGATHDTLRTPTAAAEVIEKQDERPYLFSFLCTMASSRGGKDYDYLFKVLFIGDAGVVRLRLA